MTSEGIKIFSHILDLLHHTNIVIVEFFSAIFDGTDIVTVKVKPSDSLMASRLLSIPTQVL